MGDVQKHVTRNSERKKERKTKRKKEKTYHELCYARDLMKIYIAGKFHENVIKGLNSEKDVVTENAKY